MSGPAHTWSSNSAWIGARSVSRRSTEISSRDCVEVADLPDGGRAVRDSKDPTGPALIFTPAEWAAFTAGVRDGEFDD